MSDKEASSPALIVQHTGQAYPLTHEAVSIGAELDNDIVLSDPQVSAHHARVSWNEETGGYVIEDLDSVEGVFINEQKCQEPQPLVEGDVLRLGNTVMDLSLQGEVDAESEPVPPPVVPSYQTADSSSNRPVVAAIVVVLLACVSLACLAALFIALVGGSADAPTVVIRSPADGAQIVAGNEIVLQAQASDAKDITLLELSVDETLVASEASPNQKGSSSLVVSKAWAFERKGKHVVSAVAYTAGGETSRPESVQVTVVEPVVEATTTPNPTREPDKPTQTPPPTTEPTLTPEPGETLPPPPQIEYFQASPSSITAGGCTTLQWGKVNYADEAWIEPEIGGVGTPGSGSVCPLETATYVLTAKGPGGETSASTSVTVIGGLPDLTVDSITFNPETPVAGQNAGVEITIRNGGAGAAGAFNWEWAAGSDALFDGRVFGLGAGEVTVVNLTWKPAQAYDRLSSEARVDIDGEVLESDEDNNSLEVVVQVEEPAAGSETLSVGSDKNLDGFWTSNGTGSTSQDIFVGNGELLEESGGELVARGFMSFDLKDIPQDAIVEAVEFRFYQGQIEGDPYDKLGNLLLEHVAYGDSLGEEAYNAPAADSVGLAKQTSAGAWYVLSDDILVSWVAQDLAAGQAFQIRLQFMNELDGDGEEDWIGISPGGGILGSSKEPRLSITYTP